VKQPMAAFLMIYSNHKKNILPIGTPWQIKLAVMTNL
jgi:hypothetical protein